MLVEQWGDPPEIGDNMGWLSKAKNLVGKNADKIEDGIDMAADMAKDKLPDEHDDKVDMAADKAHDLLDKLDGDEEE